MVAEIPTKELESFIKSISPKEVQQIAELRYIRGLTWIRISMTMYGYPSESRARKVMGRYLAKHGYLERRKHL